MKFEKSKEEGREKGKSESESFETKCWGKDVCDVCATLALLVVNVVGK